jgi:hypothetical protein
VCDAGNGRIVQYDAYGNFDEEISHQLLKSPEAVYATSQHLWAVDGSAGRICLFDWQGNLLFHGGPMLPGSDRPLKGPADIVMLRDGRLLIADAGNHRLLLCRVIYEEPQAE